MTLRRMVAAMTATTVLILTLGISDAGEKWQGIDEAVVKRIAREHGRESWELPFAPEGDMQLFMFLLAGAAGGFAAGYYWRVLTEERRSKQRDR